MKKYKIEKIYRRYINSVKEEKTEMTKLLSRPSLPSLISMLEFIRQNKEDWLCIEVNGLVKEGITGKWKRGVEISFLDCGDVMIIYNPMNKIDKTRPIVPDCKFTLLPYLDYKKIKDKEIIKI